MAAAFIAGSAVPVLAQRPGAARNPPTDKPRVRIAFPEFGFGSVLALGLPGSVRFGKAFGFDCLLAQALTAELQFRVAARLFVWPSHAALSSLVSPSS